MGYAKEPFFNREHPAPLPCDCDVDIVKIYFGGQHVYALCLCGNWILTSDYKTWERLGKDQQWIGPTMHGQRE